MPRDLPFARGLVGLRLDLGWTRAGLGQKTGAPLPLAAIAAGNKTRSVRIAWFGPIIVQLCHFFGTQWWQLLPAGAAWDRVLPSMAQLGQTLCNLTRTLATTRSVRR
jgi:hypothetical protein